MTTFLAALLAKLTILLVLGLVLTVCLRASNPALRHLTVLATLGGCMVLPAAMAVAPQWRVALLPTFAEPIASLSTAIPLANPAPATSASAGPLLNGEQTVPPDAIGSTVDPIRTPSRNFAALADLPVVPLIWLVGFLGIVAWLVTGRWRLGHITRTAWRLDEPEWASILEQETTAANVPRTVRLLSSPAVSTPVTWGWLAPVILLPEDALDWPETHRRIVLRHELAHVARGDSLAQLVAGVACALYWFHPLVWVAERRLRTECERACDDTVVSGGTPAAEYAAHLLEVARSARAFGAPGFLSVAMARPSQLEGRLLSVLNGSVRRASLSRFARVVAVFVGMVLLIPVAAFRPVARDRVLAAGHKAVLRGHNDKALGAASWESARSSSIKRAIAKADTSFALSVPAKSGGTLSLDLSTGGDVVLNSWDRSEIAVRASLGGRDWDSTRVSLKPTSTGAELESIYTGSRNSQSSHHVFEISVPHNYNVQLRSAGGAVSITGLEGNFRGHTGGGDITITRSSGEAELRTGGGNVHVSDSRLNGTVSTGGGTVRIEGVTGDFKGYSGGGPVIVSKSATTVTRAGGVNIIAAAAGEGSGSGIGAGSRSISSATSNGRLASATIGDDPISISTAGGGLSVPSAPGGARVTTGGGPIKVGPSAGELYVSTGGGRIDVGPASGSVVARTGAGDVTIELRGASGHTVNVGSGTGKVTLLVPADLNAVLDLETAYTNNLGHKTSIVSDFPIQVTESPNWDYTHGTPRRYVSARQAVGRGGGVIKVRTVNGDVIVRRAR